MAMTRVPKGRNPPNCIWCWSFSFLVALESKPTPKTAKYYAMEIVFLLLFISTSAITFRVPKVSVVVLPSHAPFEKAKPTRALSTLSLGFLTCRVIISIGKRVPPGTS